MAGDSSLIWRTTILEVMTYETLLRLKFKEGIPTCELSRRFPNEIERVSQVALLDVPDDILKQIVPGKKELQRLLALKKRYSRFL